jgi:hypothetical protein
MRSRAAAASDPRPSLDDSEGIRVGRKPGARLFVFLEGLCQPVRPLIRAAVHEA